jgi:hypothetical protein
MTPGRPAQPKRHHHRRQPDLPAARPDLLRRVGAEATRFLEGDPSVTPENYRLNVGGRDMSLLFGLITLRIGADSIAFDGTEMFWARQRRHPVSRAANEMDSDAALTAPEFAKGVEEYGPKPNSDGPQRGQRRDDLHHRPGALRHPRPRKDKSSGRS